MILIYANNTPCYIQVLYNMECLAIILALADITLRASSKLW